MREKNNYKEMATKLFCFKQLDLYRHIKSRHFRNESTFTVVYKSNLIRKSSR